MFHYAHTTLKSERIAFFFFSIVRLRGRGALPRFVPSGNNDLAACRRDRVEYPEETDCRGTERF